MRINCIDPKYLTDNHLIAEYREMKMITYYYVKSTQTKSGIDTSRISAKYTLNTGHAYMWFNKMGYVKRRFEDILTEMRVRGYATNFDTLNFTDIPESAFGDYTVTQEDVKINLDRILLRISKQPLWYKFNGKTIMDWNSFYMDLYEKGLLIHKNKRE